MQDAFASADGPMSLSAFDYDLPGDRIAQEPAAARDGARLLVLDRRGAGREHRMVRQLPELLRAGDVLVMNDTRVRPARLHGRSEAGGRVELLFVRMHDRDRWQCIGRPAKRLRVGAVLEMTGGGRVTIDERLGDGRYLVCAQAGADILDMLRTHGEIPLPPYIAREGGVLPNDLERYQTTYARNEGAVAAPTAGLHFTPELLQSIREKGVDLAWLTLHVGPGTFLPVRVDDVRTHQMEPELASIPAVTAAAINGAKREGRRVVAVGTTTVRTLESAARETGAVHAGELQADAFIVPGFSFRVVDALLTNFHLPRSTLLVLVSAFAGREPILAAYAEAVREGYRFYSYGDAMLIC